MYKMEKALGVLYSLINIEIEYISSFHAIKNKGDGQIAYGDRNLLYADEPCCCADYLDFALKLIIKGDFDNLKKRLDEFLDVHKYVSKKYRGPQLLVYLSVIFKKEVKEKLLNALLKQYEAVDMDDLKVLENVYANVPKKGRLDSDNILATAVRKGIMQGYEKYEKLQKKFSECNDEFMFSSLDTLKEHLKSIVE